jgi:hypothetical protein
MKERRREKAAVEFAQAYLPVRSEEEAKQKTMSTWGPYTTTSGVAKSTTPITKKAKELKVYSS